MNRQHFYITKLDENVKTPERATEKSAGLDLVANISEPITINAFERVLVPTGIKAVPPSGFHIEIRPRSGLAIKHGITVLNTPGTIDEDYSDEIKVILVNLSLEPYIINPEDRIAQMVLVPVSLMNPYIINDEQFNKIFDLGKSRTGGFGSTGK